MEDYLLSYLDNVGITEGISSSDVVCEICGNESYKTMVDEVEINPNVFGKLPVVGCTNCHYIYQNPRFNKKFYEDYYDKYYRLMLFDNADPEPDFIRDQVQRGEHLCRSLSGYLPEQGRLLDVGCSSGGLMIPFLKRGWEALGTDPNSAYVNYGKKIGLEIKAQPAEDMTLPDNYYDLIIITGSLEHVFDVNKVLSLCYQACGDNGLLLIEGRALNYGGIKGFFSHNHRRYLTTESIELLMKKKGWLPMLSTEETLAGPTRPGAVFVLGKKARPLAGEQLQKYIESIPSDRFQKIKASLGDMKGLVK